MQSTFTLEDWIFILRVWLDESYPLDQGKSLRNIRYGNDTVWAGRMRAAENLK